jgi:peptide/nickel transport system ATP-binding protein
VLDEPTTGLDVTTQAHVLRTIRELCSTYRTAALYVSHDLGVVASLADRVLVLYAGRLAELGTKADVFARPAHPYTRKLLEASPDIEARRHLSSIAGTAPAPGARPAGCAFAPRCSLADADCTIDPPTVELSEGRLVRCVRPQTVRLDLAALAVPRDPVRTSISPILTASDVVVSYGHTRVLHGASLELAPDECLALVGESGSGKTTLARALIGLVVPESGNISFRDAPLAGQAKARPVELRRAIQYVFQSPYSSLNPRRTIGQSVGMPLRHFENLGGRPLRQRVAAALERVSLPAAFAHRYPDQLSGGERQRVAIARALICEPEVLICDEITSALDVSVQATIVELLAELRQVRRLALVFVTHDLALVRSVADRVAVLQHGRVVETGAVDQVLDRPAMQYTQSLLADTPRIRGALEGNPERTL